MAKFSIKASSSPRDVGIWLTTILMANPNTTFAIARIDGDFLAQPITPKQ